MFIIPDQKMYFWKTNISRLKKLHSCVMNERTREPPALWRLQFGRDLCHECVCRFVFSAFDFLLSNTMIPRWWKFYFCSWLSRDKPICLCFRLKSWHYRDFVKNHDSNLACDWPKSFSGMIIICNRAGFCSIWENIRASLVEPWFVFWRDRRSSQNTHGETKQALIFSSRRIKQKPARLHVYHPWPKSVFLKTKISRLEKLHSCVNARAQPHRTSRRFSTTQNTFIW